MEDDSNVPDVLETVWDSETVDRLFDDLEGGARIESVQVRAVSPDGPADKSVTLREAQSMLRDGSAKAAQIRYEFSGEHWCDTMMPVGESVRIIRTRM